MHETHGGWAYIAKRNVFKLEMIYVAPAFRGQGALDALMTRGCEAARSAGFSHCEITAVIENARAERAYVRHGFREVFRFTYPEAALQNITGFKFFRKQL